MEQDILIQTSDNKVIYGVLNKKNQESSEKLIIFVHGFTGNIYEHIFHNGVRFFTEAGYDTVRFSLYWFEDDARHLTTATFDDHINDFKAVVAQFSDTYKKIILVGHSLGAQIIIRSEIPTNTYVLWEPSLDPKDICDELEYHASNNIYIEHSNVEILVGTNFVESCHNLPKIETLLPTLAIPTKIISGSEAGAHIAQKRYFENLTAEKDIHIIVGAGHTFDEGTTEQELFQETLGWIQKTA